MGWLIKQLDLAGLVGFLGVLDIEDPHQQMAGTHTLNILDLCAEIHVEWMRLSDSISCHHLMHTLVWLKLAWCRCPLGLHA